MFSHSFAMATTPFNLIFILLVALASADDCPDGLELEVYYEGEDDVFLCARVYPGIGDDEMIQVRNIRSHIYKPCSPHLKAQNRQI